MLVALATGAFDTNEVFKGAFMQSLFYNTPVFYRDKATRDNLKSRHSSLGQIRAIKKYIEMKVKQSTTTVPQKGTP